MSKKVLTDYNKQFIAENYKQLGPRGCVDALLCYARRILLGCYPYCITLVVICGLNENMIKT